MDILQDTILEELGLQGCALVVSKEEFFRNIRMSFVLEEWLEGPFGPIL